ncbi:unnamed protein product [Bursaphelenchus okinawaensis]|uniref:Uncharacterized protein n=1 Tax=Bursaphelenchus okinawaensis TaxID=465554 RepID=A0A811KWX8_9BILA|nr:unnamed protein product [Bursaphelenchus okinawaensis]CAG9113071.1 unnamed protein product [Bursaphelenchus okinawaensis]
MQTSILGITLAVLITVARSWAVVDGPSSQYEHPEARYMPAYEEALYRQKLRHALSLLEDNSETSIKRSPLPVVRSRGAKNSNKFFRRLFYAMRTGV